MKKFLLTTGLIFISLLGACNSNSSSDLNNNGDKNESPYAEYEDTIKVGLDVDANNLDVRFAQDHTAERANELIYEGLVVVDENLEVQPALAKKWEIEEDGLVYIFELRDDVEFHDGEKFDANDVKYTYDKILDKKFGSLKYSLYQPIKSVEVIEDYLVKFTLKKPYSPFLSILDMGIVPEHLGDNEDFATNPIGTGPYKFKEWQKNSKISFVRNDNYWGEMAKTENIIYFIIPDNNSRISALEAGDIDLIHSPLTPQDIMRLEKDDSVTVERMDYPDYNIMKFNVKDEFLSDQNVRIALAHLIDRDLLAEGIYDGYATSNAPILAPLNWEKDVIEFYQYSPEKSADLLEKDGWSLNGDGYYEKDGKVLTIELMTHSEDSNRIQIVEQIQNVFESNGIKSEIRTQEFPSFYNDVVIERKFQLALFGSERANDPDHALSVQFKTDASRNDGLYSNSKVDELINQAREELNDDKRAELYKEAYQIIADEVGFAMTVSEGYTVIYNKKMTGLKPHVLGKFTSLSEVELKK